MNYIHSENIKMYHKPTWAVFSNTRSEIENIKTVFSIFFLYRERVESTVTVTLWKYFSDKKTTNDSKCASYKQRKLSIFRIFQAKKFVRDASSVRNVHGKFFASMWQARYHIHALWNRKIFRLRLSKGQSHVKSFWFF